MQQAGLLAFLYFSSKYKLLIIFMLFVMVFSSCYLGSLYTSKSIYFKVVLIFEFLITFIIIGFAIRDLTIRNNKAMKENNEKLGG